MRRRTVAVLLGLCVFGLFGVTTAQLTGYEPETAAVTEALVQKGQLRVLPGNSFGAVGAQSHNGYFYSRTGLAQPLLEVPLYWVGEQLDHASANHGTRWRQTLLQLFNPAMAALTVVAIFALLCLRGVTERRALFISGLCAIGTLIWPYSKIGLDTTLMAMLALTVLAAAWTAQRASVGGFALLGSATALTMNSKPYGSLLLLGVIPLAWPAVMQLVRERRAWVLGALAAPVLLGLVALGWYNWYRTGSVTSFANPYTGGRILAMPFSVAGLLISPGKGLIFYSPLVVLGVIGLREMWPSDRPLALTIVLTVVINVLFIATSYSWSDETWGPRYIVPSVWLLVLPIAWWMTTRRRRRWLAVFAAFGIAVQFVGVFASYVSVPAARTLAGGEPVYLFGASPSARVAYGDDGPRWVPQASPLLFQFELVGAYLKETLTGTGFTVSYQPYRGSGGTIDLLHPTRDFGPLPDFWWTGSGKTAKQDLLVALLAILCLVPGAILARTYLRRPTRSLRAAT